MNNKGTKNVLITHAYTNDNQIIMQKIAVVIDNERLKVVQENTPTIEGEAHPFSCQVETDELCEGFYEPYIQRLWLNILGEKGRGNIMEVDIIDKIIN